MTDWHMNEVSSHPGRVWTNVLSLRREDAQKTGFENREAWMRLFQAKIHNISRQMNIPASNLKAYGAFHNEGHHPHCHFIVYSGVPNTECLYKKNIEKLKSDFAHGIFGSFTLDIEKQKGHVRDELRTKAREEIKMMAEDLRQKGFAPSSDLEMSLVNLARKLPEHGRKAFKFLPKELKPDVIKIVDIFAAEPEVAKLYEKWKIYQHFTIRY